MNKKNIPNKTNLVPLQGLGVLFVLFFFFCSFSEPDYSWTTPSRNSSESMPCGGGDIGLNVWVENGDVLFYVSRSGAFDENNTMLKQGRFRIRLTPNPFLSTTDFRQTLKVNDGNLEISANGTKVVLFVDVNKPVIHFQCLTKIGG
jgi:hypothetical protein